MNARTVEWGQGPGAAAHWRALVGRALVWRALVPAALVAGALVAGGLVAGALVAPAFAQTDLPEQIRALDANGNGVIERDEAQGPLADNFDDADLNRDGVIDGEESTALFARFRGGGGRGAPERSGAGTAQAATPDASAEDPRALPERARGFDTNGNGVIDRDEAGGPLAANFDRIDENGSGGIDGAELAKFFGGGSEGTAVEVDVVRAEGLSQTVPVIGRLVALQSGPVASRVSGPVAEVRVEVGDRVSRGDIMVVISHDRLQSESDRQLAVVDQRQAMVEIAAAELEKSEQEMDRLENLRAGVAFSQKRYDDMVQEIAVRRGVLADRQAQLAQATEQLNRANIDRRDADIRAPYSGVVTQRYIEVGAWVTSASPVVTLLNDTAVEIEVDVPANRLAGLEAGSVLAITLDDGTTHKAAVRAIVPVENPLTRTRPVRLVPDFDTTVKAPALNQSVTVAVPIGGGGRVLTVHKDAVVRPEGRPTVYVVVNNTVQPREVVLGPGTGQRFVVVSGVAEGDQVVVRGNEQLEAGQRVRFGAAGGPRAGSARTD